MSDDALVAIFVLLPVLGVMIYLIYAGWGVI